MKGTAAQALANAIVFLAKRDGIDKVLKLIRYAAKLVLAAKGVKEGSPAYTKLKSLDQSLGTTRKALRVGKFLSNVKSATDVDWSSSLAPMQVLAATGEGVYYFLDQFVWLVKSGVLDSRLEAKLSKASAWAELVGYSASIYLNITTLAQLSEKLEGYEARVAAAEQTLRALIQEGREVEVAAASVTVSKLRQSMLEARALLILRMLLLVQDASDSLIAVHEVSGGRVPFVNPVVLAVCGLVSGSISSWKNWPK